jgi:hypothetical protein
MLHMCDDALPVMSTVTTEFPFALYITVFSATFRRFLLIVRLGQSLGGFSTISKLALILQLQLLLKESRKLTSFCVGFLQAVVLIVNC